MPQVRVHVGVRNFLVPSGCHKHPGTSDFHPKPKNWSRLYPNERLMYQISISRSSRLTSRHIQMHWDGKNHPGTVCITLCSTMMHPKAPRKFLTFFFLLAHPPHEILSALPPSGCLEYTYSQVFGRFGKGLDNIYHPQSPGLKGQAWALEEDKLSPQALQAHHGAQLGLGFEDQVPRASGL